MKTVVHLYFIFRRDGYEPPLAWAMACNASRGLPCSI